MHTECVDIVIQTLSDLQRKKTVSAMEVQNWLIILLLIFVSHVFGKAIFILLIDGLIVFKGTIPIFFFCGTLQNSRTDNPVDNFGTVVGENPTPYGILALWAVNSLSIVYWEPLRYFTPLVYNAHSFPNGSRSLPIFATGVCINYGKVPE